MFRHARLILPLVLMLLVSATFAAYSQNDSEAPAAMPANVTDHEASDGATDTPAAAAGPIVRAGRAIDHAAHKTGQVVKKVVRKTGEALKLAAAKTEHGLRIAGEKTGEGVRKAGEKVQEWSSGNK